ncbi:hypothetical protein TOPH_06884 [Tolypocladium ophioglossoides CBS 100239]|uniref:Uncharacterized protein n=1 Tax=Tolypocladium ophioglossoides (strain CBS 100239) TaxID=1163406 RepID=A0A0L0N3A9_TOLOC|nr:hypothetical protein TOPH_06884 [Tolypocladium ophioglossoides CBS 100239]
MDALKNLIGNIPDWQRRLNDLAGQIDRRQAELAALGAEQPRSASARSLRNKGSSESLRPKDEGPLHMDVDVDDLLPPRILAEQGQDALLSTATSAAQPCPPSPESANRLALHKQARDAVVAAHSRALAQAKKKRRASSMVSAEGAPPTYRTRSMIIVYYDSYVQGFFDELVRFVSSSRNLMRKARMAAKVAQIKRMAELEMPDDDNGSGEDGLPSLRYMSTRRLGPMSTMRRPQLGGPTGPNDPDQAPDVYETLDKGLEFVQSTCEHGAHQFLRDADCEEEISKIQVRMNEVLATAKKEMERVQREEPELAKESRDMGKPRARRPISVRRDMSVGNKGGVEPGKAAHVELEATALHQGKTNVIEATNTLEVDTNPDADESLDMVLPELQYRSMRYMRSRAG